MKKVLIIAVVVLALAAVVGVTGLAYAQNSNPDRSGFGPGMMGGRGGPGMQGGPRQGDGMIHDYFVAELAEALDMTAADVEARLDAGETAWEIAASTGLSDEEVAQVLSDAHNAGLDAAVEAGVITQEQADWMKDRMQGMGSGGYGSGMMGGGRRGSGSGMMGRGGRSGNLERGEGPVHEYFVAELAETLDLEPEAVETRLEAGETAWEIAASTGLSDEEVAEVLTSAHNAALDAAVEAGVITQEQADWMKDRMEGRWGNSTGPGTGGCQGGGRWYRP